MAHCWTKACTAARPAPCTVCSKMRARRANAATSSLILPIRNRSCWPPLPISSGVGIRLRTCRITKLLGPAKWTYFYLYVILDVFSRYVVGWLLADRESKELAKQFIAETCQKQGIVP